MTSKKAERFISRHIRKHKKMGMSQKQSVAVALHEAREKGYNVPRGTQSMENMK